MVKIFTEQFKEQYKQKVDEMIIEFVENNCEDLEFDDQVDIAAEIKERFFSKLFEEKK